MEKVLVLNANSKSNDYSRTYKITERFLNSYKKKNPDHIIEEVNLFELDFHDVDQDVMQGFGALLNGGSVEELPDVVQGKLASRQAILSQFKEADKIVLSTPMWDLGNPAVVKKWVDNIVVANETFKYTENGPVGLVEGKKALFIQSTGGVYDLMPEMNFGLNYFKTIMGFIGISDFTSIHAYGMDSGLEEENLPKAMDEAIELGKKF